MPVCFVPGCKSGLKSCIEKRRFFFAPKEAILRVKWDSVISRSDTVLTDKSKVCELHFEDDVIIKGEFLRHSNGSEEFIPKLRWKLKSDAIPTLHLENGTCNDYEITLTTCNNLFSTKNYENASYFYRFYVIFQKCAPSAKKAKFSPFESVDDALLMQDNIINVESPFQMENLEAVADVDVVHDGSIPSQTIHLDFEPIYPGTHNEGISQTFPTASY
jgi:hypothetical protein